jgi:hypothetical protein
MDSSVSPKEEIWFLRVCHHISNAVYHPRSLVTQTLVLMTCLGLALSKFRPRHRLPWWGISLLSSVPPGRFLNTRIVFKNRRQSLPFLFYLMCYWHPLVHTCELMNRLFTKPPIKKYGINHKYIFYEFISSVWCREMFVDICTCVTSALW